MEKLISLKTLNVLSDLQIILVSMTATCLYAVLIYGLLYLFLSRRGLPSDNYFGVTIVGTMTSLNAVLFAFVLIQSIQAFKNAEHLVLREVASLDLVYARSRYLPVEKADSIQFNLKNYLDHFRSGWHYMIDGKSIKDGEQLFNNLLNSIHNTATDNKIHPQISRELMVSFSDITKTRQERRDIAGKYTDKVYYRAVIILLTIHILQFFLLTNKNLYSLFILCIHQAALGVLLGLIIIYDHPFQGDTSITTEPYILLYDKISNENESNP